jgi:[calcium/calmodulin-dependent protein kinase] kinase
LKIVDFGVSEMFDKQGQMKTAKSAGSPAFMPPELCVAKHGEVDGRAVDIWSAGVTLYCLMFGRIPFEKHGMLELYEAIRTDDLGIDECNPDLRDLLSRLLEKDPQKRLKMDAIRVCPVYQSWDDANTSRNILGSRGEAPIHYYQQRKTSLFL